MPSPVKVAEVLTIGQLAETLGVPRNTLWRRLLRLAGGKGVTWMFRRGRHWAVNVDRLRKDCPEFALPATESERLEDHEARLHTLETLVLDLSTPRRNRQSKTSRN